MSTALKLAEIVDQIVQSQMDNNAKVEMLRTCILKTLDIVRDLDIRIEKLERGQIVFEIDDAPPRKPNTPIPM